MEKKLAIVGNKQKSNDIIKLLESFGCVNEDNLDGSLECYVYTFDPKVKKIEAVYFENKHIERDYIIITIDAFEKMFPYKKDDKVICFDGVPGTVVDLNWNSEKGEVLYGVDFGYGVDYGCYYVRQLKPYKCKDTKTVGKNDAYSLSLTPMKGHMGKYKIDMPEKSKIEVINGEYYLIEELKFPKTIDECREILGFQNRNKTEIDFMNSCDLYDSSLMVKYSLLKLCRDAYWKVLGDYKPDYFNTREGKYVIECRCNKVSFELYVETYRLLTFPTEEVREAFYENFKKLIEECKELI